jgi:hypothetical protein
VQPWRVETFKFATDPELLAKVTDVGKLCLAPPENAIVLCVDEKSQVQLRLQCLVSGKTCRQACIEMM